MDATEYQLVVFKLDEQRYALRLSAIDRIIPVVQITALPQAPQIVLGIINIHGRVLPVADARRRFGLPPREIELTDQLIIARTSLRIVALLVDQVMGLVRCARAAVTSTAQVLREVRYVEGVVRLEDGLVLIHDLDTFLSPLEEQTLRHAVPP